MIKDVTETANRPGCIRAERKGKLALVLSKLDYPIVRLDGKRVSFQIEEIVLSQEEDELACVWCNEYNYYSAKELASYLRHGKDLFTFLTVS